MPRQRAAHLPSSVLLVEQLVRATTAVVPIPTLWTDAYRTNGNQRWAVPAFDGDAVLEFIEHSEADLLLFEQALAVLRLLADGLPPSAIDMDRPHHRVFVGAFMVAATQSGLSITANLRQFINNLFEATEVELISRQIQTWLDVSFQRTRAQLVARVSPLILSQRHRNETSGEPKWETLTEAFCW